jgi:fructokinase
MRSSGTAPLNVVAIGEVLWDVIGTEKYLGGAPFNFAVHCHYLGARSSIVSRVGCDELGDKILARAEALQVDPGLIQRDPAHPTGQVHVTLQADGQPEFVIQVEVAYDYLGADPAAMAAVRAADVVCFGTLCQRHAIARQSITALLEAAPQALIVCDLNLRSPHYSLDVVCAALESCDLLKLNDDELRLVRSMLNLERMDEDTFMTHLLDTYRLEMVCVTLGARGCILRTKDERVAASGYICQVVDTVGAGDAFMAALLVKSEAGLSLAEVADFANVVGAYVATQRGATPPITTARLDAFLARSHRSQDRPDWDAYH